MQLSQINIQIYGLPLQWIAMTTKHSWFQPCLRKHVLNSSIPLTKKIFVLCLSATSWWILVSSLFEKAMLWKPFLSHTPINRQILSIFGTYCGPCPEWNTWRLQSALLAVEGMRKTEHTNQPCFSFMAFNATLFLKFTFVRLGQW